MCQSVFVWDKRQLAAYLVKLDPGNHDVAEVISKVWLAKYLLG